MRDDTHGRCRARVPGASLSYCLSEEYNQNTISDDQVAEHGRFKKNVAKHEMHALFRRGRQAGAPHMLMLAMEYGLSVPFIPCAVRNLSAGCDFIHAETF